jgi:hypothetical protein
VALLGFQFSAEDLFQIVGIVNLDMPGTEGLERVPSGEKLGRLFYFMTAE